MFINVEYRTIEMTDRVHTALSVLEAGKTFCNLEIAIAITNLLTAFEEADNVNITRPESGTK